MANINDLMLRYKTQTAGAIRKFITRHLDKINSDGIEHAKQTPEGWYFDAEAVRIIDELRGVSQVAVIEQVESERVKELQEENENLRQLLLMAQSKLIKTQEELQENQKLLSSSEKKLLAAENQSKDKEIELVKVQANLEIEKTHRKNAEDKIQAAESQVKVIKQQRDELNHQLERLKNRGLLDRMLNRN